MYVVSKANNINALGHTREGVVKSIRPSISNLEPRIILTLRKHTTVNSAHAAKNAGRSFLARLNVCVCNAPAVPYKFLPPYGVTRVIDTQIRY
jgi:hypothetical protein